MKRFFAWFVLGIVVTYLFPFTAYAQIDSVKHCREQADSLLQAGLYAEAYKMLDYYLKNAPVEERQSIIYTEFLQKRSRAYYGVESVIKDLYKKAETAMKLGKQEESYHFYDFYLQNCVIPDLKKSYPYTVALTQKALFLQGKGEMGEALSLLNQAANIRQNGEHIDYVHSAETYNYIAAAYAQQGQYNQAIEQCEKALEIYKKRYGKKHKDYITTLNNLAGYYTLRNAPGDCQHAGELRKDLETGSSKDNLSSSQAISDIVAYYSLSDDKDKLRKHSRLAKKTITKQEHLNNASILGNQAVRLAKSSNYAQAVQFAKIAISIYEQNDETQNLNFAQLLFNAASFEKSNEHYSEAIELWKRASAIYEKIQTRNGSRYIDCMSEISAAYSKMGNLEQATSVNEQLMETDLLGEKNDMHYLQSFAKRASIMAANGDYKQAILLESKALEGFRFRKELADEAVSLSDISSYLYHLGRLEEAVDTCQASLAIYEKIPDHEEDKGLALNNLSLYYNSQGKYEDALQASRKAVLCFEKANRTESSLFTKVLANMALYEASQGNFDRAIAIGQRADTIQQKLLGKEHPDNVMPTYNRAIHHIYNGDYIEGQRLYHKAMMQQMNHVRSDFSHLTTREREMYWGTKRYVFSYAPYLACRMADNDSALVDAYNSLLFTKGILLNSEVDFRSLLSHKANKKIQEKYAALEAIHKQIEEIWRNPTAEKRAQIEKLSNEANRLERELTRSSKEFGDFTAAMNIDVSQVKQSLPRDGAAIEFFDIETKGENAYWALLVRQQDSVPHLVWLFNESELDEFAFGKKSLREALLVNECIDSIYNSQQVGMLIWAPLMRYLKDIHSIWFSPSGLFYQFGIEYLNYEGNRLSDLFSLHRVSSTKQIVGNGSLLGMSNTGKEKQLAEVIKKASVFGGLDYDASPQQIQAANDKLGRRSSENVDAYFAQMSNTNDIAMAVQDNLDNLTRDAFARDGLGEVKFLKGTEEEAKAISGIFYEQGIDPDEYYGAYGTEEAFKSLADSCCPTLLHVATHGFALSEDEVEKNMTDLAYLGVREEDMVNQADNSLCYAGLLMAGANSTLGSVKRNIMPKNMENGILTAREIARMDFSDLELVVLSACQTGCGVLRDDGVFGLQRGFKKAGAHTLLMSLWSVDDKATKKMMTVFYEELARGLSRRAAFHAAQQNLRTDPKFSNPRFWASFIMLDD